MRYQLIKGARVMRAAGRFEEAALLVDGDRIAAVLTPREVAEIGNRDGVAVVTLERGYLVPGFVDAHFHLVALVLKGTRCDLSAARSSGQVAELLRGYAERPEGDGPVVGVEWDESGWSDPSFPTREQLDSISTTRPVFARRICGHVGTANTALLRLIGEGYRAHVDTDSGTITERAVARATELTRGGGEAIAAGMEGAIRTLHALGITGIHDIIEEANYDAYLDGLRRTRVPLRIDGIFHTWPDRIAELRERAADTGRVDFRVAGIKIYLDGSVGGLSAALHEPYNGYEVRGSIMVEHDVLASKLRGATEHGVVCAVHAIGDRAIATVLDEMRQAGTGQFRVEHAEIIGDGELDRLRASGIPVVMQPNFVRNWGGEGGLYHARLGTKRWHRINPFRLLHAAGVAMAFSSDGMPPGPLYGLRGATRHPIEEQRLDPLTAFRLYTEAAHRLLPAHERPAGTLEPEQLADIVHLSHSPLTGDLDRAGVLSTWVGGVRVLGAPADRWPKT